MAFAKISWRSGVAHVHGGYTDTKYLINGQSHLLIQINYQCSNVPTVLTEPKSTSLTHKRVQTLDG